VLFFLYIGLIVAWFAILIHGCSGAGVADRSS
jgi:hypothetical protein